MSSLDIKNNKLSIQQEQAGYKAHNSELLYYVEHQPRQEPKARVLLAGPLPDERTHAYLTLVRWARLLADNGYSVIRFDYRGTGESTGRFENTSLTLWSDDIRAFQQRVPSIPCILHGFRLGGLLCNNLFMEGLADILLTWDATPSGENLLFEAVRRQSAANLVQGISNNESNYTDIIKQLESGSKVEINGYLWSFDLWMDARDYRLIAPTGSSVRPSLDLKLTRKKARRKQERSDGTNNVEISWPPFWVVGNHLIHDVDQLFRRSLDFITANCQR